MRHLLVGLLALCLAVLPASADFGAQFYSQQGKAQPIEAATLVRATCVSDTTDTTTYNPAGFQAISTGLTTTDTALIVWGIASEDGAATFGIGSSSVNGIAGSELTDQGGTGLVNTAIYAAPYPISGAATVNISVTHTEAVTGVTVCVWALKNLRSATATSVVSDEDTASGALVLTLGTNTLGGFGVGICNNTSATSAATWAALTEREDTANADFDYSNSDAATTGSSMSVTCDWTNTNDAAGSAAAFR